MPTKTEAAFEKPAKKLMTMPSSVRNTAIAAMACSDCLPKNNVDNHVAHADEHFVADDGEALDEVDFYLLLIPAEMLFKSGTDTGTSAHAPKSKMTKTLITAAKDVASAAPRTPISGKPNFP